VLSRKKKQEKRSKVLVTRGERGTSKSLVYWGEEGKTKKAWKTCEEEKVGVPLLPQKCTSKIREKLENRE